MNFRRLFRFTSRSSDDVRRDLDDEISFHIETRADALRSEGMSPGDARAQARREFGQRADAAMISSGLAVERRRSFRRLASELQQDTTYGIRLLARSPGFALACVVTLAVGIGGTTAVFSVVNAAFLAPPPIAAAGEVVRVQLGESRTSSAVFEELRTRNTVFATMAAISNARFALGEPGSTTPLMGERVTTTYFSMLGVAATLGRTFDPADVRDDLVVLGERAWRVHFNGDAAVVGRRIRLDRRTYEVIGVMPRGFRGLAAPGWVRDCWIPLPRATTPGGSAATFEVAGRLRPGIDASDAAAALRLTAQQLRTDRPELPESLTAVRLLPVGGINAFRGVGALVPVFMFIALLALVATFVLSIGCANIAGLLLGRAVARRHELALRAALGAARTRLIRQLLTESLLLAGLGGAAGVLLASWLTTLVPVAVAQLNFPFALEVQIDWRVLAFTSAVSLVTAILFGLAPARHAVRVDLGAVLRDGSSSARRQRLRQALVVCQVAACATLLVWGLLFTRSLGNVTSMEPGFDASGVLLADFTFDATPDSSADAVEAQIVEMHRRASALPFVESVGGAWAVPLSLTSRESFSVFEADAPDGNGRVVNANRLTPGWFETVRIPLLTGRDFTWNDRLGSPEVAIVNRTLAERFWNGRALGKRLRFIGVRNIPHEVEIVGVVGDSKYWTIGEAIEPVLYLAARQGTIADGLSLHVRTSNIADTSRRLSEDFARITGDGHIELRPMADAVAVAMMPARVGALVTTAFAAVAVLLATMGIYALISFSVAQRTREIGVRKALGASPMGIVRLIVSQSLLLVAAGLSLGILIGVAGGHVLANLTVGVSPGDPLTIAIAVSLVLSAALLSSSIPALRAARADPLEALRQD
ncbi:MAG TPA: ADOP family duplicated permease [Vicinamibacterales bacterium]|jgi:predicted permease|nr:ADOP family duplicated permease [Vicinamibacterales bacterium]